MPQKNAYIYRITSFDRVVQMLERNEMFFAHPKTWDDPFEKRLKHTRSHAMFATCWCKKGTSDAMWRIYSPNHLGLRIRTTKEKLRAALANAKSAMGIEYALRDVTYDAESEIENHLITIREVLQDGFSFRIASDPFFFKRSAFSHEYEVRAVIHDVRAPEIRTPKGIAVPINSSELIDGILLDPRTPDEFVRAFSRFLSNDLKFPGTVRKSSLYASRDVIEV